MVYSFRHGAPMGRDDTGDLAPAPKLYLGRVPLDRGGYDPSGAYWGIGEPLFKYFDEQAVGYLRAPDRDAAKEQIRRFCPGARFYR